MRRLFSGFARGLPGVGLLLLRMVAGGYLIMHWFEPLQAGQMNGSVVVALLAIVDGALLLFGLWTPFTGPLVVVLSLWEVFVQQGHPSPATLLAAIGAALALIGPGALSLDARLFGWKKINLDK
jgi:putative oxidoreductase